MAHTYTSLLVHVISSTKDRRPLLEEELRPRLFSYIGGDPGEVGVTAVAINGPADHVHALLALPAAVAPADALRVLKTNSSRWVHEQWPGRSAFAWQSGYGAFSVSRSNREEVERYIANQEEHHKHVTFQEEYLAFQKRHGIAFGEQYVWE